MSRRNRREPNPEIGEIKIGGIRKSEELKDGGWIVVSITGSSAVKDYRCPGCDMTIPQGTPHLVAWPDYLTGGDGAVDERRHWHTQCWRRRTRQTGKR